MIRTIEAKVREGQRLSTADASYLLGDAPLMDLGALAARRPDCGLDAAAVRRYLQTFEYRFGPRAWSAVDRFRELDAQVSVQHDAA